jgi:hypothetical protein
VQWQNGRMAEWQNGRLADWQTGRAMLACLQCTDHRATCCLLSTRLVKGDILAADLVALVLRTHNIDTIMHFAGEARSRLVGWPLACCCCRCLD